MNGDEVCKPINMGYMKSHKMDVITSRKWNLYVTALLNVSS